MTMLAATRRGGVLTHAQVHGWLQAAGLRAIRLLEPIGFNQVYVATRGGPMSEAVDLLVEGWYVVTMGPTRDIIRDGAVAVRDGVDRRRRQGRRPAHPLRRGPPRSAVPASSSRRGWSTPTSTSPASR